MRVTKTIREYVESEVGKKFEAQIAAIGGDYEARRDHAIKVAQEFTDRANEELAEILRGLGMYDPEARSYSGNTLLGLSTYKIRNADDEREHQRLRNAISTRRHNAIQDILLGLELGETNRSTLREALDSIDTDVE